MVPADVIAWKFIFFLRLVSTTFLSKLQLVLEGGFYSKKDGNQKQQVPKPFILQTKFEILLTFFLLADRGSPGTLNTLSPSS